MDFVPAGLRDHVKNRARGRGMVDHVSLGRPSGWECGFGHPVAMWRELIAGLTPHAEFTQPASEDAIARAPRALGGELPEPLVSLLRETDGVRGQYGLGVVWPLRRILDDNTLFRSNPDFRGLYMPFDPLLFSRTQATGTSSRSCGFRARDEVFAWDHETDSRRWVAPSLEVYLKWWLDGTLKL